MKKIILNFVLLISFSGFVLAQTGGSIYNPTANVESDFQVVLKTAKSENKFVLLQIGGNWCSWCLKFHKFLAEDVQLDSIVKANYVKLLVNYSEENKNEAFLKKMGFPQRFGYPVFVITNSDGQVIHIQDSGYLEGEGGYDRKKVKSFLLNWTKKSVSGN